MARRRTGESRKAGAERPRRKPVRRAGQQGRIARRRWNAAYRRANKDQVEQVQGAIEAALAEGARLRDEISRKIGRRSAAAGKRETRASRRK
jgi:hypothetical protein